MTGLVVWWPYAIVDIPNGWHLCDGEDGTPDYRNYVLIGAGDLYTPGQILGALTHFHQATTDPTADGLASGDKIIDSEPDGHFDSETSGHTHPLTTDAKNHLPPAKAGCWIQKV